MAGAGAVALQMLFAGIEGDYTELTHRDLSRAQMQVTLRGGGPLAPALKEFRRTEGVRSVLALSKGALA